MLVTAVRKEPKIEINDLIRLCMTRESVPTVGNELHTVRPGVENISNSHVAGHLGMTGSDVRLRFGESIR